MYKCWGRFIYLAVNVFEELEQAVILKHKCVGQAVKMMGIPMIAVANDIENKERCHIWLRLLEQLQIRGC